MVVSHLVGSDRSLQRLYRMEQDPDGSVPRPSGVVRNQRGRVRGPGRAHLCPEEGGDRGALSLARDCGHAHVVARARQQPYTESGLFLKEHNL
jgi:hypothetical protein